LHVVVERSKLDEPGESLDVGIERMKSVRRPFRPERVAKGLDAEGVGTAEHLVVDQPPAEGVAECAAVAPVAGEIQAFAVEIGIAETQKAYGRMTWPDRSVQDERDFVARLHKERDAALIVRDRANRRIGDEWLRAKDALRVRPTQLVARVAARQQQAAAEDLRIGRET